MSKILILKIKGIKGKPSYDENGKILSQFESFKIPYNSMEWRHFINNMGYHGFGKVTIEEGSFVDNMNPKPDQIRKATDAELAEARAEIKKAFDPKPQELTPEQKKIADLEAKIEALMSAKENDSKEVDLELSELREKYESLAGKKGDKRWTVDTLKEKITELEAK